MIKEIQKLIDYETSWLNYLEKEHYNLATLKDKTADAGDENYNYFSYLIETKYTNFFRTGTKYNACKASWCTLFQGAALCECFGEDKSHEITGIPRNSYAAVVTYWKNYMKSIGRLYSHPAVGSFVFFGNQHIGFVISVESPTKFTTIEGNTSSGNNTVVSNGGGVFKKSYTLTSSMSFGRPLWNLLNPSYVDPFTLLTVGDCNVSVRDLQSKLKDLGLYTIAVDGDFGNGTLSAVKAFQKKYGLTVDGVVGSATFTKLNEVTGTVEGKPTTTTTSTTNTGKTTTVTTTTVVTRSYLCKGDTGDRVKTLQNNLNSLGYNCGTADGVWGNNTQTAVGLFQSDHGLVVDYEWGAQSEAELQKCLTLVKKYKLGIDLSAYQGCYNMKDICDCGGNFVIIRGAYSSKSGTRNIDNRFIEDYNNAKAAKLNVGIYYYSLAKTVEQAEEEAEFLYQNCLKGRKFELPIYIDIEDKDTLTLGKAKVTEIANAFVDYLNYMGYVGGTYSSVSMFNSYFNIASLHGEKWVASWGQTVPAINDMGVWQFGGETNKIRYCKINNMVVDQDFMIKDYSYIKTNKLNGFGPIKEHSTLTYCAPTIPECKIKEKGAHVAALQAALNYKKYNCGEVDGDFGNNTLTQLKKFQSDNKLTADGECGKNTWEALLK